MNLDAVARLILAAGGSERQVTEVTKELGLDVIAPVPVDETAFRVTTTARIGGAEGEPPGRVALPVHHDGATAPVLPTVAANGRVTARSDVAEPGVAEDVATRLEYELPAGRTVA